MMTLIFKTVLVYFILILSMRIMGKRQLGELQASEFIIAIMLSEIATMPITNEEYPIYRAIVAIGVLVTLEILVSTLLIRSNSLKQLLYGKPVLLINRGQVDISAMKKNRIELDELLCELRQKGYSDLSHINYAILEKNGKISVFPKADDAPPTAKDLGMTPTDEGIAHILIIDGTILHHNLKTVGWTHARLRSELNKSRKKAEEIFLLSVDDSGSVTVIPR